MIQDQVAKIAQMGNALEESLGASLFSLVHCRVSQLNGCAFCLDMDVKKARLRGERDLRMYHISVWRESNLFSDRERAALEWAEAVTKIGNTQEISDEIFGRVREHFAEKDLVELTLAISLVNVWNRLAVSFRAVPGSLDAYFGLDKVKI